MTGKDLWQILWIGTSHCADDLINDGKKEDLDTNLVLVKLRMMDEDSLVDINNITWDHIKE